MNFRVVAAVAAAVAVAAVAIFLGGGGGSGAKGPQAGSILPPFAAPLAASGLVGDANVALDACRVDDARALVGCREYAGRPFVIGFIAVDESDCTRLLPALAALGDGVSAAAVGIRRDRKTLAELAAANPGVAVAWDRDGALANRMGVAVCPTVVVVERGGTVAGTLIGDGIVDPDELEAKVRGLLDAPEGGQPKR